MMMMGLPIKEAGKKIICKRGRRTRRRRNRSAAGDRKKKNKKFFRGSHVHGGIGFGSLPGDILVDVLGRVASSSFTDLFNAKLCCREFLGAAEDEYIFQNISIDKFPVIHWFPPSHQVLSFLNSCIDRGNPESLFRQGMIEYFSSRRAELGLEYLKRATEKGHIEATYVYGIILLSNKQDDDDQLAHEGLKLLNSVLMHNPSRLENRRIRDCRARIKAIVRTMWINNSIAQAQQVGPACTCRRREDEEEINERSTNSSSAKKVGGGSWNIEEEEDYDVTSCDTCRWNKEVVSFCKILNGVV